MTKLPFVLNRLTKGKVGKMLKTSEFAIRDLEKAKRMGLLPKEKADAWIKQLKEQQEEVKEKKENEFQKS